VKNKGDKCTLKPGRILVVNRGNLKSATPSHIEWYLSDDNVLDSIDTYLKSNNITSIRPAKTKNISTSRMNFDHDVNATGKYLIGIMKTPETPEELDRNDNIVI